MLNNAYIGLGSNLGDSAANLRAAIELMREFSVDILPSPVYRTAPIGFRNQPAFHNAVCRISTRLTPFELMEALLRVEAALGRRRVFRNAPRLLDLDILFYGRRVLNSPPLTLPHPRIAERPLRAATPSRHRPPSQAPHNRHHSHPNAAKPSPAVRRNYKTPNISSPSY